MEAPALGQPVYRGKAKDVYRLGGGRLLLVFRDEVTAFNGRYRDEAPGKGVYAAKLSARLFEYLEEHGVVTHYICYPGGSRLLVREARVLPIEVIVRLYAYGSMLRRMPLLEELKPLREPLVELHYKSDELGDPLLHPRDVVEAGLLTEEELSSLEALARRVAGLLESFWRERGLRLIDLKLEVARANGGFMVVDELSGDTMRLLDAEGRHLDKEVYRRTRDPRLLVASYQRLSTLAGPPQRGCSGVA